MWMIFLAEGEYKNIKLKKRLKPIKGVSTAFLSRW